MSLEKDITEIKQLVEQDEPIFKAASPEELKNREEHLKISRANRLYDRADEKIPGSVEVLRKHFGREELVQAAIAYADSQTIEHILKVNFDTSEDIRDLGWEGIWTDAKTFIKQCEIVESYNSFDVSVAKIMVKYFKGKQFRLAREGSVAVYVRPLTEEEFDYINPREEDGFGKFEVSGEFAQDETSLDGDILRLWWD
jgi:hypothetical protein